MAAVGVLTPPPSHHHQSLIDDDNDDDHNNNNNNNNNEAFVEMDPARRYGLYADLLGVGGVKKVYRGFDLVEGIEVAWNQVSLRGLADRPFAADGLSTELKVLRAVRHKNILPLHHAWKDPSTSTINFITELCTSGDLRSYRRRHRNISAKVLRRWMRQILVGLHHLHTRSPHYVVIHRDLNCSNIFINGYTGEVKIGDLGLAAVVEKGGAAHAMVGTPEFMAPEVYAEEYTEKVDIYAFGMCVLELVTMEVPYAECGTAAGVYLKVAAGGMPEALGKVRDPEIRELVERCLGTADVRPSASELLEDPFFRAFDDTAAAVSG